MMDEAAHERSDAPPAGETLDFAAFLARFFPNRCRHNFAAITAYAAYRDELEPRSAGDT